MYHCIVWIGEPSYGWAKPFTLANWQEEIKVKVNGKECISPNCEFTSAGMNMLVVNARAVCDNMFSHVI